MATGILVLFCVATLNFGISTSSQLTLKHVVVTYRSGEHTPCDFTDGPEITKIPESNSTLTKPGVDRAYNLGQKLGKDYKSKFSLNKWSSNDYYSMGTPAPRCQMSALNFGAGLEEDTSKKVHTWDETEKQKAETQNTTFPHSDQYLMFLNTSKCPGFYTALKENLTTWRTDLNNTYFTKLQDVTKKYSTVNTTFPYTVWLGYEIFQTQNETNHTEMTWLSNDNWGGLSGYSEDYIFKVESEEKLKKLSGGIMVDSILNVTEKITKGEQPQGKDEKHSHKMSVLAVSQAPLAAMLGAFTPTGTTYNGSAFNAKDFYPRNGAHHVVEIYQEDGSSSGRSRRGSGNSSSSSSSSKYKVKVMYAPGGGNDTLIPLKYSGCDDDGMCPYDTLKSALQSTRLPGKDQEKECKPHQQTTQ